MAESWPYMFRGVNPMPTALSTTYGPGHYAVDIPAPAWTPIASVGKGIVKETSDGMTQAQVNADQRGHFITVELDDYKVNGKKVWIRCLHLAQAPGRNVGSAVAANHAIGYVGTTGSVSTGNHLHFDMNLQKVPTQGDATNLNPCNYFSQLR